MEIMQMAQAIGLRIKYSEEGEAYFAAKAAYEGNREINNAMLEYQIQQSLISNKEDENGDPMSEEVLNRVNARIDELYEFITEHEAYKNFEKTENALNELIKKVNATILAQVTGKAPSDCTHDCSTCGGCH